MHYLSVRMTMLSTGNQYKGSEVQIYRLLTIALLLGSKFLDDNTFINRSWSEVSGISVTDLNHLEMEWLLAIEFKLHRDPLEQQGFGSWHEHWLEYERQAVARSSRATKLSPIDTTVQHSTNKPLPPTPYPQGYGKLPAPEFVPKAQQQYHNTPAYPHYDPWLVPRSANDRSPGSAPSTGPNTPEFYGGPGTWAPPEGYSRRTMFGFHPQPQAQAPSQHQAAAFGALPYNSHYSLPSWTGHVSGCNCSLCVPTRLSYFISHSYGPQPVAG